MCTPCSALLCVSICCRPDRISSTTVGIGRRLAGSAGSFVRAAWREGGIGGGGDVAGEARAARDGDRERKRQQGWGRAVVLRSVVSSR